jgi:hypothetical protein
MWLLWSLLVHVSSTNELGFASGCNGTSCGPFQFLFRGSCRSLPRNQRMTRQLIVVDDFYSNPEEVRKQALQMSFGSTGYFPGRRTAPYMTPGVQATLETLVGSRMTRWTNFHGSFQYTLENHTSWVHFDEAHWSALVYLTPDAPLNSGTRFYQHIETRLTEMPTEKMRSVWESAMLLSSKRCWTTTSGTTAPGKSSTKLGIVSTACCCFGVLGITSRPSILERLCRTGGCFRHSSLVRLLLFRGKSGSL